MPGPAFCSSSALLHLSGHASVQLVNQRRTVSQSSAASHVSRNSAIGAVPRRKQCAARVEAMVKQAEWSGPPAAAAESSSALCDQWFMREKESSIKFGGIHHVAIICANFERSLEFYCGLLGLRINKDRPHGNLPYRGAWLWTGPEMIHLMELPNPDPMENRADHGGRDRHACFGVEAVAPIAEALKANGIPYTMSKSGRAAIFFRDPDMNTLECVELPPWR